MTIVVTDVHSEMRHVTTVDRSFCIIALARAFFLTSDRSRLALRYGRRAAGTFRCNSKRNSDTLLRYSLLLTSPITTLGNRQSMYKIKRRGGKKVSPSASRIFNTADGPRGNARWGSRLGVKPGLISNNQDGRMSRDWRKHWSLMDWMDSSRKRARYVFLYVHVHAARLIRGENSRSPRVSDDRYDDDENGRGG